MNRTCPHCGQPMPTESRIVGAVASKIESPSLRRALKRDVKRIEEFKRGLREPRRIRRRKDAKP